MNRQDRTRKTHGSESYNLRYSNHINPPAVMKNDKIIKASRKQVTTKFRFSNKLKIILT